MRRLLFLCFALLSFGHLYYYMTGDFSVSGLMQTDSFGTSALITSEIKDIFNQPFFFLDHGHQTFAFVSQDQKYVLKLFKKDYLRRTTLVNLFPPIYPFKSWLCCRGTSREKRRKRLLNGYRASYLYDRENSGLLYFHPKSIKDHCFETTLITGLKKIVSVDLNSFIFALQRKTAPTKKVLSNLLKEGNIGQVKKRIDQLFALYYSSFERNMIDLDHNLLDNTGFIIDKAIRHDVGKVVHDPKRITPDFVKQQMQKIIETRLKPWLQKKFPLYANEVVLHMSTEVSEIQMGVD